MASVDGYVGLPVDQSGKKMRTHEVVVGGNTVEQQDFVLCDRNGNIVGARQYGPLRVSPEEKYLFLDTHDQALDTTNRWTTPTGTNAPAVSNSVLAFGVANTASIYGKLPSQPTFSPLIPGWLQPSFAIKLDPNGAAAINGHRFWGVGTSPATPATTSSSTKLTDAIGFEIDTDGKMYSVVYAAGVRTAVDLSSTGTGDAANKQPLDGGWHRYLVQIRTDRIFWFIDGLDTPVANVSFVTPTTQTLPVLLQTINPAASVAAGGYPLSIQGSVVSDTAGNHTLISDGTFPWRKATVSAAGRLGVDSAIPLSQSVDGTGAAQPIQFAYINTAAQQTGASLVAAPGAGRSIRVISYAIVARGAVDLSFIGMPTTVLFPLAANGGVSFAGSLRGPAFQVAAATALTYTTSAAVQISGHVAYVVV